MDSYKSVSLEAIWDITIGAKPYDYYESPLSDICCRTRIYCPYFKWRELVENLKETNRTLEELTREEIMKYLDTEHFQMEPYENQEKVAMYLENGKAELFRPGPYPKDVFTGETIPEAKGQLMSDGEFAWEDSLSYYVRKYNYRLSAEIEGKMIKGFDALIAKKKQKMRK